MKCKNCKHPQGVHELGRGRGSCVAYDCPCRGFDAMTVEEALAEQSRPPTPLSPLYRPA
jgi:hypothetical protein